MADHHCACCGEPEELRMGFCFDCATKGEERAAKRSVLQHVAKGVRHIFTGHYTNARIDFSWAWERLTRTGDYKPGGEFDRQGYLGNARSR
jgi:hypothetical protein